MKQELNLIEIERESTRRPVRYQPTTAVPLGERLRCLDDIKFHLRRLETAFEIPPGAMRFQNTTGEIDSPRILGILTDLTSAVLHTYLTCGFQKLASAAFKLSHVATMQAVYANGGSLKKQTISYKKPYTPPNYTDLINEHRSANPFRT